MAELPLLAAGAYPELEPLGGDVLRELFAPAHLVTFKAGHIMISEGRPCMGLPFVFEGEKRIYKAAESGKEITLYEVGAGQLCPQNVLCVLTDKTFPSNAECISDLQAIVVPAEHVRKIAAKSPELMRYLLGNVHQDMTAMLELLSEVTFRRINDRLTDYLLERAENGMVDRTHQQIANDLGTLREVVSRLLKGYERQGLVVLSRSNITLTGLTYGQSY